MSDATHAYVGIHDCGRIYAASVIRPEYAKDLAKFTADIVKAGWLVERWAIPDVQGAMWCKCFNEQPEPVQTDAFGPAETP